MKLFITICLSVVVFTICNAQAPSIVKAVKGATTEPDAKDQEGWKSNEWNGLFFYQGTGSPTKLCVTDGSNAGTLYLADVGSGNVVNTIPAQSFMYIITNRLVSFFPFVQESQIWKSDGTTGGTSLLYTMPQSGVSNSNIWTSDRDTRKNFSVSGNTMFFNGYDAVNGNELWITDGTAPGTHIVKDIKTGTGSSSPMAFCKIGADVFFTCFQTGLERKLWKTDGSAVGTVQIPVAEPFFILDNAVGIVNNKMIFYAHNTVDGYEPYVSDGTAAGTFMLKDINIGGNSWISQSQNAHLRFNSQYCFFVASNGTANAFWRTDGTSAGTIQLTSNAQAAFSGVSGGSYTDVDNTGLWMIEYNSSGSGNAEKLYRSDGTVAGTYQVATALSYAQNIKIYKGSLWMASRNTGSVANVEPWRSGGNTATTKNAFDIAPGSASSGPYGYFVKNDKLYFFASTSIPSGHNLYQYTGDFTFNGSQANGAWRDSANWNGMMPPGITDSVFINSGTPNALNVNTPNAYAGTLTLSNNATINLTNATDSLIVNNRLNTGTNNSFTGNGVVALQNIKNDTIQLSGGFTAANIAVQSNSNLVANNIIVTNNLHLTNNAQLILNNNSTSLSGTTSTITQTGNSYVNTNGNGKLIIENIGAAGRIAPVTFPIGTSSNYNPVIINNNGSTDNFGARVQPQLFPAYTGETGSGSSYITNAVNTNWFITEANAGGSNADITLQWNTAQELPGFSRAISRFGHYTGGAWQFGAAGAAAGSNPYTYSGTAITSFSPFGIFNDNPILPLQFVSFSAQKCNNRQVCLNWKTTNEQNVSHFEIERSADGRSFGKVWEVPAKNHSSNSYAVNDDISAMQSTNQIYYRIKQIDIDGKFTYTTIQLLHLSNDKIITIYPNPVNDELNITNWNQIRKAQLIDIEGRKLKEWVTGISTIYLKEFVPGIYLLKMELNSGEVLEQKIIKR